MQVAWRVEFCAASSRILPRLRSGSTNSPHPTNRAVAADRTDLLAVPDNMSDLGNIDDDPPTGEDGENTSKKSERKRQREKQRRSDLANAFDELANLLSRIEPDDLDASSNSRRRRRRNSADDGAEADADAAGMTRLDLIGRTVDALRRLHRENAELRQNLLDQQRRSASAMGSNEDTVSIHWCA